MESLRSNINQVSSDFRSIKEAIVNNGVEVADGTKTSEYASKVNDVYDAGKQAQYDEFWDNYQNYGESADYQYSFGGRRWTDEIFMPKYDLVGSNFYRCFHTSGITVIDKVIDASNTTQMGQMFYNASVVTIKELKFGEKNIYSQTFAGVYDLTNLTATGTIAANIDFSPCAKLTKASLLTIINALKDNTGGTTLTLTLGTTNLAKLTDEEKAIATQKGWTLA